MEDIFAKIYERHIKQLKNTSVPNKKLVICFSGIPGSGKTYISEILEDKYKGVRIRSDDIRDIIRKLGITGNNNKVTYEYLYWLFENYDFPNKLIILDRGIDRKYEETISIFKKKGYPIFIIRVVVSRELSEKRIIEKLGKLDDNYINSIDRWVNEWNDFGKKIKPDIIIENEDNLNLTPLFEELDNIKF